MLNITLFSFILNVDNEEHVFYIYIYVFNVILLYFLELLDFYRIYIAGLRSGWDCGAGFKVVVSVRIRLIESSQLFSHHTTGVTGADLPVLVRCSMASSAPMLVNWL